MILSSRIWEELDALAAVVDRVDHDTGDVRFKPGTSAGDMSAVQAIIAAHNPALQDSATIKKQKDAAAIAEANAYGKLTALKTMTPAQVQAWVAANVTNLAQAQDAIATLAIGVSVLARRV